MAKALLPEITFYGLQFRPRDIDDKQRHNFPITSEIAEHKLKERAPANGEILTTNTKLLFFFPLIFTPKRGEVVDKSSRRVHFGNWCFLADYHQFQWLHYATDLMLIAFAKRDAEERKQKTFRATVIVFDTFRNWFVNRLEIAFFPLSPCSWIERFLEMTRQWRSQASHPHTHITD